MPIRRSRHAARIQTLKQIPLFSACSNREVQRIASVATEIHVEAGRALTATGQPGGEFFVVMSGSASVWKNGVLLDSAGPGSFFGEVSLLDGGDQTVTVVSETEMRVLVLNRQEFAGPSFFVPSVMDWMLVVMSMRLRRADRAWTRHVESVSGRAPAIAGQQHRTPAAVSDLPALDPTFDPAFT